jgi:small subunit ribosomal protein S21
VVKVVIREGESLEKVFKKFKRRIEQSVILKELRKKEFFLKPSQKKKIKRRTSHIRVKKREKRLVSNFFL